LTLIELKVFIIINTPSFLPFKERQKCHPFFTKGELKTNTPSFPAYTAGKMPPLLKKGNLKTKTPSFHSRQKEKGADLGKSDEFL